MLLLVLAPTPGCADSPQPPDPARFPVTRDLWVSAYHAGETDERPANLGGADRLKFKGIQEMSLLDIDPARLRGRVIQRATLHLRARSEDTLQRVTVSTLAGEWTEGDSSRYRPQAGASSFQWAAHPDRPWAWPGSDLTAVMGGNGHTLWGFADAAGPDADGWQTIAVDPRVVAARVAGLSHGFVVMDDVGSEWSRDGEKFEWRLFPNRYAASREAGAASAPYFTIEAGPADAAPPAAITGVAAVEAEVPLPPGQARVRWTTPADDGPAGTLGFHARWQAGDGFDWNQAAPVPRYLIPMAGPAGTAVVMTLQDLPLPPGAALTLGLRPVDAAGNVGPLTTLALTLSPEPAPIVLAALPPAPPRSDAPLPAVAGLKVAVIDPLDKLRPDNGEVIPQPAQGYLQANHLWSAGDRTLRLAAGRNEFVAFQVALFGRARAITASLDFPEQDGVAPQVTLLRPRHVRAKEAMLPDPLLPLAGPLSLPLADEEIPGQQALSLFVDVYVPHAMPPGRHRGTLRLSADGETLALPMELTVWRFTLPDELSFIPQMNCYGLPNPPHELAYYRLAHAHRTTLNRLPYNWRGEVRQGFAPPRGEDGEFDWTAFDQRFGPLLDGSAFADLPRAGVPVEAFYLPLNENWPASIEEGYRGGYWADEALTPAYRAQWVDAAAQFTRHFQAKGWDRTFFEFYLNNKVYYKQPGWSRSSAPWIFDEPVNTQDFWALRWYGQAFHEGVAQARTLAEGQNGPAVKMAFRGDISRPQWQRDLLDGLLDVNVVGGALYAYERRVRERKERFGEVVYQYGSVNPIGASNVQPAGWCLDIWSRGFDGVLPWQTMGKAESWEKADPLAVIYPHGRFSDQPAPSLRLKAFRRGQQDVEYLTLLGQALGLPRWRVASLGREHLILSGTLRGGDDDQAGTVAFETLSPAQLWTLRLRVGATLDRLPNEPPVKTDELE